MTVSYRTKTAIVCFMHFLTWPLFLPSIVMCKLFKSGGVFNFAAKLISLIPGKIGTYLRASFYCMTLSECKYDIAVGFASFFAYPTSKVGRQVVIGCFSIIGTADIGNNVFVSSRVSVMGGKYQHDTSTTDTKVFYDKISIGDRSWLGEGSIVMCDLESDCTVSAGSVVTKPMPQGRTAIGNPARFLKKGL